jgi:hypothetical protein
MLSKRGLVAVVALMTASALAVPASASAAGWLQSTLASGPGENRSESHEPDVAVAPNGNTTVVWSDEVNPSGITVRRRIQSRTYFADGSVGPIRTLSNNAEIAGEPRIDVDGASVATVVWSEGTFSAAQVMFLRLDPSGVPTGIPQPLSPDGDDAFNLGLDVNSSGEALVSWANGDAGQAQFIRIAANGTPGSVTNLSVIGGADSLQSGGGISIDDEGRGFAGWSEFDGDVTCCHYIVQGRTINPNDSLDPIRLLSDDTGFPDDLQSLIDSQGKGTAVWYAQETADPFTFLVYENQIDASGTAGSTQVVSDEDFQSISPNAAVGPDDAVTISWQESNSPADNLRTRQISASGALSSTMPTVISGSFDPMELAFAPSGTGLVTYTTFPGSTGQVAAHPIDSTGAPIGSEALLTPDDGKNGEEVVVALGPDGSGMAAWERPNPEFTSDDYYQVEGAYFDGTPPSLSAVIPGGGTSGESVVMAASATDRSQVSFSWSFGDGASGSGDIVQHSYASPGTYAVTVTATDAAGNASTAQGQVKISAPGSPTSAGTGKQAAALKKCKKIKKKKKRKRCINRAKKLPV